MAKETTQGAFRVGDRVEKTASSYSIPAGATGTIVKIQAEYPHLCKIDWDLNRVPSEYAAYPGDLKLISPVSESEQPQPEKKGKKTPASRVKPRSCWGTREGWVKVDTDTWVRIIQGVLFEIMWNSGVKRYILSSPGFSVRRKSLEDLMDLAAALDYHALPEETT